MKELLDWKEPGSSALVEMVWASGRFIGFHAEQ